MGWSSGGGAAAAAVLTDFYFGVTPADGVYTDFALLEAALDAVSSALPRKVWFLESCTVPASIHAAGYDFTNVAWMGNSVAVEVTTAAGFKCQEGKAPSFFGPITVTHGGTAPFHDQVTGSYFATTFDGTWFQRSGASVAWRVDHADAVLSIVQRNASYIPRYGAGKTVFSLAEAPTVPGTPGIVWASMDTVDAQGLTLESVAGTTWVQTNFSPLAGVGVTAAAQTGILGTLSVVDASGRMTAAQTTKVAQTPTLTPPTEDMFTVTHGGGTTLTLTDVAAADGIPAHLLMQKPAEGTDHIGRAEMNRGSYKSLIVCLEIAGQVSAFMAAGPHMRENGTNKQGMCSLGGFNVDSGLYTRGFTYTADDAGGADMTGQLPLKFISPGVRVWLKIVFDAVEAADGPMSVFDHVGPHKPASWRAGATKAAGFFTTTVDKMGLFMLAPTGAGEIGAVRVYHWEPSLTV